MGSCLSLKKKLNISRNRMCIPNSIIRINFDPKAPKFKKFLEIL